MALAYTENAVLNLDRLLAATESTNETVLLFDNGQKLSVPESVKSALIEALKQQLPRDGRGTGGNVTDSPQTGAG